MKTIGFATLLLFVVTSAYSQINYEKGYFIDLHGRRVECLIKNKGWGENPSHIEYRPDQTSPSRVLRADSIDEFGIENGVKYVGRTVKIDRSQSKVERLSDSAAPVFNDERLFLKVLVEGKADLFSYEDGKIKRFFFSRDDGEIEQLIFKLYREGNNTVRENNRFRQQLWNSLTCESIERESLERMNYTKSALTKVFSAYNACTGSVVRQYATQSGRQLYGISVRPRWNNSSFAATNAIERSYDFDWPRQQHFGLGIEGEFFLNFRRNKWSVLLEPTYRSFEGTTSSPDHLNPGSEVVAEFKYTSIEVPVGVRHYFFINDASKIFLNASYAMDFATSDSRLTVSKQSGYQLSSLEMAGNSVLAFGAGLKYRAFGIEFRYHTKQDLLRSLMMWDSQNNNVSVIAGYTIVRKVKK